jgi:hypothetical protein
VTQVAKFLEVALYNSNTSDNYHSPQQVTAIFSEKQTDDFIPFCKRRSEALQGLKTNWTNKICPEQCPEATALDLNTPFSLNHRFVHAASDNKLGVNCERNIEKIFFVSVYRLFIKEYNFFFMTFHSQSSQHPFVICQQQVQNGDFTKTAR